MRRAPPNRRVRSAPVLERGRRVQQERAAWCRRGRAGRIASVQGNGSSRLDLRRQLLPYHTLSAAAAFTSRTVDHAGAESPRWSHRSAWLRDVTAHDDHATMRRIGIADFKARLSEHLRHARRGHDSPPMRLTICRSVPSRPGELRHSPSYRCRCTAPRHFWLRGRGHSRACHRPT